MPFIAQRGRREDRYLEWKIGLFSVAAAIALVGIYLDERWMTGTALGLLCAAMLLRFLPDGGGSGRGTYIGDPDGEEPDATEEPDAGEEDAPARR